MRDTVEGFDVVKRTTWHPAKMPEITFHAACVKPDVQGESDYNRLKEDIGKNGIRQPIIVQKSSDAVVAGRHRIKIARELGVPIPVVIVDISDSEAWSLSRSNLCHRNLSATRAATLYLEMLEGEQKALKQENKANAEEAAQDKEERKEGKAKKEKERKRGKRGEGRKSEKQAKAAGVSRASIERVKRVKDKGIPALWKAMDAEEVTATDADYIVDFDHDVQRKALALVKDGKFKTLKAAHAFIQKEEKREAGPVLRDGMKNEVPKKLVSVFEDRGQFAVLREQVLDIAKSFGKLLKRESAKHIPKEMATHLADIAQALDVYQPYAVDEKSEDGWITKRDAVK